MFFTVRHFYVRNSPSICPFLFQKHLFSHFGSKLYWRLDKIWWSSSRIAPVTLYMWGGGRQRCYQDDHYNHTNNPVVVCVISDEQIQSTVVGLHELLPHKSNWDESFRQNAEPVPRYWSYQLKVAYHSVQQSQCIYTVFGRHICSGFGPFCVNILSGPAFDARRFWFYWIARALLCTNMSVVGGNLSLNT